jgi:hypothetical protein
MSTISSASTTPLLTPSFEPNTPVDLAAPSIIAAIKRSAGSDPIKALKELDLPEVDLSENVSALLKVGTSRAHVEAENSLGAAALVKGELDLQEYIRWLAVLWRVYE